MAQEGVAAWMDYAAMTNEKQALLEDIKRLEEENNGLHVLNKKLKQVTKTARSSYEAKVWERVDAEHDFKNFTTDKNTIEFSAKQAEEAAEKVAKLQVTLDELRKQLTFIRSFRETLQRKKGVLSTKIAETRGQIGQQATEISATFQEKEEQTKLLKLKFQSRRNICDVLLQLHEDIEVIRRDTKKEMSRRGNLENMLDIQMSQMKQRIEIGRNDREMLHEKMQNMLATRLETYQGLQVVGEQIQDVMDASENSFHPEEHSENIKNIVENLETHLIAIDRIDCEFDPEEDFSLLEETEQEICAEFETFVSLERHQAVMAAEVKQLGNQLTDAKKLREKWEQDHRGTP